MKDLEMNPYVIQIDKFVNSLEKLSKVFLDLEEKKTYFSEEELKGMCQKVCDKVCQDCGNREICLGRERMNTYGLLWDIFQAVENYGTELNVEVKRKVQKNCVQAPKFVRNALEIYKNEKQTMLWNQKMAQSREGCAVQLDSFAQMIQHAPETRSFTRADASRSTAEWARSPQWRTAPRTVTSSRATRSWFPRASRDAFLTRDTLPTPFTR